jgi:glutamate racemase
MHMACRTQPRIGPPSIGVFDSGVGGLSVLRALRSRLPHAHFVYLADAGHAPYGERCDAYVLERSRRLAQHLLEDMGCRGVVVACNTATAVAIEDLRERWPGRRFVGVEPGVKPAALQSGQRRIGVLATHATLRHERFRDLVRRHAAGAQVTAQSCPGLAMAIEQGDAGAPEVERLLVEYCARLRAQQVDTVVLGCTHYAFVRDRNGALLGPEVRIVETADAVARQAARLFGQCADRASGARPPARLRLQTTGCRLKLQDMTRRWLGIDLPAESVSLDRPSIAAAGRAPSSSPAAEASACR